MAETDLIDWQKAESLPNILDAFFATAEITPNRLFCIDKDHRLSYREAAHLVRTMASHLAPRCSGQDVVLILPNGTSFLLTYLSVLHIRGKPVLLNASQPEETVKELLANFEQAIVISNRPIAFISDGFVLTPENIEAWAAQSSVSPTPTPLGPEDLAAYFFTGGTTGIPKHLAYTHQTMVRSGVRMMWGWPVREGEVFFAIAPCTHIYGFLMGVCLPLLSGGTIIALDQFRPAETLAYLEREKVSVLGGGPPAVYQALLSCSDLSNTDLSSLRVCPSGGAPFPPGLMEQWFDATGLRIYEGYGMTEIAPVAVNTVHSGVKPGTVGKPAPDTRVEIVDIETGKHLMPEGEAGEIRIQGPQMLTEYCGNANETAHVFRGGWIYSGDIGLVDEDGFLKITDRKKDVILHNGYNVFPREVEDALARHKDIANVCVVGKPDERSGELVVAFLQPRKGKHLSIEDLNAHCETYLIKHKQPGEFRVREKLPLTPVGKLDRALMRDLAMT